MDLTFRKSNGALQGVKGQGEAAILLFIFRSRFRASRHYYSLLANFSGRDAALDLQRSAKKEIKKAIREGLMRKGGLTADGSSVREL